MSYVCPHGHEFPGLVTVKCKECEALVACEPVAAGLAIRKHRDEWVQYNGRNPGNARPADLELWEIVGGIDAGNA